MFNLKYLSDWTADAAESWQNTYRCVVRMFGEDSYVSQLMGGPSEHGSCHPITGWAYMKNKEKLWFSASALCVLLSLCPDTPVPGKSDSRCLNI